MNRRKLSLACFACMTMLFALGLFIERSASASGAETTREKGFLLKKEPEDAKQVKAIREKAKNGEAVVVVGRIGGRTNPWVKGTAAFSIVDSSLKSCDQIEGDACPTPWDYCCEADINKSTLLVAFVDDAGKIVKKDARQLLKVKELQTVVVQGKVKRDKSNNVSLLASKLYVRNLKKAPK
jgi:hypothetical protein